MPSGGVHPIRTEKALKDDCPVTIVLRQSTRCFSSGIQNDRVRLSKDKGLSVFFLFNEDGDLARRVKCEMVNAPLRTTGKVHELRRVGQTCFLKRNRGSDAIAGLRTVKLKGGFHTHTFSSIRCPQSGLSLKGQLGGCVTLDRPNLSTATVHTSHRRYFAVARAACLITSTTTSGLVTGTACEEFTSVT